MKYAIKAKNLSKQFVDKNISMPAWLVRNSESNKFYAVKDVSFKVGKGEIFGILGPNGCGKSTVIRMISTLLMPDKGEIRVLGIDALKEPSKVKKIINRVSVEASFFKRLSARENLLYASRLYGMDDKESEKKFMKILEKLGFSEEDVDKPMYKFSRGMQQKVSIARGFVTEPKIALLDEPTTGLDPKSKLDVQGFLTKVHSERELTIVISSHDMEEIDKLCDRIAIMNKGRIIALGTSEELKNSIVEDNIYELNTSNNGKAKKLLESIEGIERLHLENGKTRFSSEDFGNSANRITTKLEDNNIKLKYLNKVVPTLEDVFLELTGRSLEDEEE